MCQKKLTYYTCLVPKALFCYEVYGNVIFNNCIQIIYRIRTIKSQHTFYTPEHNIPRQWNNKIYLRRIIKMCIHKVQVTPRNQKSVENEAPKNRNKIKKFPQAMHLLLKWNQTIQRQISSARREFVGPARRRALRGKQTKNGKVREHRGRRRGKLRHRDEVQAQGDRPNRGHQKVPRVRGERPRAKIGLSWDSHAKGISVDFSSPGEISRGYRF